MLQTSDTQMVACRSHPSHQSFPSDPRNNEFRKCVHLKLLTSGKGQDCLSISLPTQGAKRLWFMIHPFYRIKLFPNSILCIPSIYHNTVWLLCRAFPGAIRRALAELWDILQSCWRFPKPVCWKREASLVFIFICQLFVVYQVSHWVFLFAPWCPEGVFGWEKHSFIGSWTVGFGAVTCSLSVAVWDHLFSLGYSDH